MKNKKQQKQSFEECTGYSEEPISDLSLIAVCENYSIFKGNKSDKFFCLTADGEFRTLVGE